MTNKKYTNEDIISSLKIIATTRNCNECKIRNCKWGTCNCEQITANAALDLITCLQAENEKNENIIRLADKTIETANAEIERLKTELDFARAFRKETDAEFSLMHRKYGNMLKTAKSEVYKECVEKVKERASKTEYVCSGALVKTDYTITEKELDNIIKETETEKEI